MLRARTSRCCIRRLRGLRCGPICKIHSSPSGFMWEVYDWEAPFVKSTPRQAVVCGWEVYGGEAPFVKPTRPQAVCGTYTIGKDHLLNPPIAMRFNCGKHWEAYTEVKTTCKRPARPTPEKDHLQDPPLPSGPTTGNKFERTKL